MTDNELLISNEILEHIYQEFTQFLQMKNNEDFNSFKKSEYVDYEENYKYLINQEAKKSLRISDWKSTDVGTGKIQNAVLSAMRVKVTHNHRNVVNNLINWHKINDFAELKTDKYLEQVFFDLYKNKITPQSAFENLMDYLDYQTIAYLFFIKDSNQFLPISQEVFDKVISEILHIQNFKTSRNKSWGNYKNFIEIIKQTHRFLRTKDNDVTLLDAHSFLWILGKQREDWLKNQQIINLEKQTQESITPVDLPSEIQTIRQEKKVSHFFQYWLPHQVESDRTFGGNLRHAGSNQFERRNVNVGDVVWVVTVDSNGELYLVGKMIVDNFVDYKTALGMFNNEVIQRDTHIIVDEEKSEPFKEINLMDVIAELRFKSSSSDHLTVKNGRIDAKQLQTIRELTAESANLVLSKWVGKENNNLKAIDYIDEDELKAEEVEKSKIQKQNIPETEKEQLILARRGQGRFRVNLEKIENSCRVTGLTNKNFLIASHIKAWKDSTNEERLDGNNGLLLSPHVDKLFDKGWISFSDDGKILSANDEVKKTMKLWGLDCDCSVGNFNQNQKIYLAYHRKKYNFE